MSDCTRLYNSYAKFSSEWLMNDGEFLKVTELLHRGNLLFHSLHLQLNAMVTILVLLRLIVESTDPAGAFTTMEQLTLNGFVLATHHSGHCWNGHQVDECSGK